MAKRIQVGGRIESKEVGGIVTGAAEILDDEKGKKQSVINGETDDELARLDQSKQDNLTFDNAPTEGSDNPVKSGGVFAADKALSDAIEAILLLIPSAASALNKLVDTAMMNSSISTATATFRGTYNVVMDLSLTVDATHEQIAAALGNAISTADNNDYAFVQVPVSAESTDIRRTERYKFNGTVWGYEYDLNTSGFTAAQWAAINSGITIALVGKLIGLPTSSELQALLGQKQDTLTFDNVPTSGSANPVKSGGVHTAINDEKTAREQLAQTVTDINGRVGNVEEVIPTGAAANNKLVANNSMEAYVTSIIEAITASFTIATADGHINLTLTQTNGRVASLTLTSSDIASAQALTALTGRVSTAENNITTINGNITTLGGRVNTNETDIANLQQLYNDLQQSKPEPVTALPETGQQQGVIYRLAGTTSYSDYMWNGSTWVLMATYNNAIDPRPKKASQNLVTSGGVFDNMGALDVSELNATENPHTLAQYTDLSAALAAIPTDYQKGGMSIKFVQSSDNNYIQARLMANSFTTDVTKWQVVDDEPINGSKNLIDSGAVAKTYGFKFEQTYPIPESTTSYPLPFKLKEGDTIHIYNAVITRYGVRIKNNSTILVSLYGVDWVEYTATTDLNNLNIEIDSENDRGDAHIIIASGLLWEVSQKENADSTILKQANVVNNLKSTSAIYPLSANQGKVLNENIVSFSKEIDTITSNYMWNRATSSTEDPNPTDYDAKPRTGSNITFALANNTIFPYIGNIAQFTFGATGNIFIYQLIELDGSVDISSKRYKIGFEVEVNGHITDARIFLGDDNHKITTGLNIEDSATTWQSTFNGSDVVARNGKYYIWLRLWANENSVVKVGRFTVVELQSGEDVNLPYPALRLDKNYKKEIEGDIKTAIQKLSPYTDKKFYSIGDSITYQKTWQQPLADILQMNFMEASVRDADYPLGIGGSAICPRIVLRTTNQGDDYKALDGQGNQLVDGQGNPLWFEVGKAPKQSVYYRADYLETVYTDAEVIVMVAGQNDGNKVEAGDDRKTYYNIGSVSDSPYTGLQYVNPEDKQVALYYPNVAIYDPDGTISQDPTYSGCTFISERPTFCACLAGVIKKICTSNPEARFLINTIMRYATLPGQEETYRVEKAAAMKAICEAYDIPCANLWDNLGVNAYNHANYYKPNDGIHPNAVGGRRMAAVIAQKL